MTALPCPQPDNFSVISGFMTPGANRPGGQDLMAGSITAAILDPTEDAEPIRVVATDDPFSVEVDWCVCGPLASTLGGCWYVQVLINDIDGVGPTHGQLGRRRWTWRAWLSPMWTTAVGGLTTIGLTFRARRSEPACTSSSSSSPTPQDPATGLNLASRICVPTLRFPSWCLRGLIILVPAPWSFQQRRNGRAWCGDREEAEHMA